MVASGCALPSQPPLPSVQQLAAMDESRAANLLNLSGARWGYLVVDAETGTVVAARHPDEAFPPASTAKLPTMVAALGILGPDYRFTTEVSARGSLKGGVLTGDLILTGNGDPLLSAGDLRALAIRLSDIGIVQVDGRYLYHSLLPVLPLVEATQPLDAPYNQGVSGLNIEFNRATITRQSSTQHYTTPEEATPLTSSATEMTVSRTDYPVRAPDRLAALMLARFAKAEGISLPEPQPGLPPDGAVPLAQIRSQPLIETARAGLEYSNNLVAEAIGLAASHAQGNSADTLAASATTLGIWLERQVPGLNGFAQKLANHSGLSTESRITPRQMTAILGYALHRRFDGWRFDSLLAPGGAREGYRGRFKEPETAFRIWAKSGTMRYIKGLAGYLDAQSGRRLMFALFVFAPDLRAQLDHDQDRRGAQSRRLSDDWRIRTDKFEAGLIMHWISAY